MNAILIVDDDASNLEVLEFFLLPKYQCARAVNAEQALKILEHRDFDLVITDLNMPGASGFDLCREIRHRWPKSQVIVISGLNDSSCYGEAMRAGAVEFMTKPLDLVWLSRTISRVLDNEGLTI